MFISQLIPCPVENFILLPGFAFFIFFPYSYFMLSQNKKTEKASRAKNRRSTDRIRKVARRHCLLAPPLAGLVAIQEVRFSTHPENPKVKTPIKGVLLSELRTLNEIRTFFSENPNAEF